jgi:hypothetical protein
MINYMSVAGLNDHSKMRSGLVTHCSRMVRETLLEHRGPEIMS